MDLVNAQLIDNVKWAPVLRLLEQWGEPLFCREGQAGNREELDAAIAAAETRLGATMPVMLREWFYLMFLVIPSELRFNDPLLSPEELNIDDFNGVVIQWENQCVVVWSVLLKDFSLLSPPVYMLDCEDNLVPQDESLIDFAYRALAREIVYSPACDHSFGFYGSTTKTDFQELLKLAPLAPIPAAVWPAPPAVVQVSEELLLDSHAEGWVFGRARNMAVFDRLKGAVLAQGGWKIVEPPQYI